MYPYLKRAGDIFLASVGLLVASLPMAVIAVWIRATMGSPVLFRQRRVGRNEQTFELLKFRSMRDLSQAERQALSADQIHHTDQKRLTPLGNFLRKTSLDELPQLWNVLRGDMSLVGPRPLLVEYLDVYTSRERMRHRVRPGITGLAQVHGRNRASWEERLEWDATYVERQSLALDLKILFQTFAQVLRRQDTEFPDQQIVSLTEHRRGQVSGAG